MSSRKHQIDLDQIEVITALSQQLAADLQLWNQYLAALSLNSVLQARARLGLHEPKEGEDLEAAGVTLAEQREKIIKALKHHIWNASNTLKQLHEGRQKAIQSEEATNHVTLVTQEN